ncbi:hypothetical protein IWW38_004108 [Coemansia aciculifera]|uniref:Uncharacterized protein n=1 Tax=Coemansia aciculifera TaxID=417176 RepID=A0ACC1LZF7_9FUNG|nr:hypothetical protein IWW38_004108 [Coemansia aciculifera]
MWTPLNGTDSSSGEAYDEKSTLDTLRAAFERDFKFKGTFPQFVSTGLVYIYKGDRFVEDTAATAFSKLSGGFMQFENRQHARTVVNQAGKMISAADDQNQVVIAIADAMAAHNAAYVNSNIVHGNISDRVILFHETAGGVTGAVAEFGDPGDSEVPAWTMFRSIRSLENAEAPRTRLDDWESLMYVVIFLAAYGVNDEERDELFSQLPKDEYSSFTYWVAGHVKSIASSKRMYMDRISAFYSYPLSRIPGGPLRDLAKDIFKALLHHPGCAGAYAQTEAGLERERQRLLRTNPNAVFVRPRYLDPLDLRDEFEDVIVANLLRIVAKHKQAILVAQGVAAVAKHTRSMKRPRGSKL